MTNFPMTKDTTAECDSISGREFDLAERTAKFGETVVRFGRSLKPDVVARPLIGQLVRAATSIGANYLEADEAGSKKEFRYRVSICKREARETQHWLRMLVAAQPEIREPARELWKESRELVLIFSAIFKRSKPK
jgi:four helix bundle protein